MSIAFIFPGQGSQAVGMGAELAKAYPGAKAVFAEVDEALGQALSTLMWDGPEDRLTLTENAQPALMAVSLAVVRVIEREGNLALADKAAFVAGHSLGEYSALAAAGALSIADTARLLKCRGQAMQAAVPVGQGAMAALLGLDLAAAKAVALPLLLPLPLPPAISCTHPPASPPAGKCASTAGRPKEITPWPLAPPPSRAAIRPRKRFRVASSITMRYPYVPVLF